MRKQLCVVIAVSTFANAKRVAEESQASRGATDRGMVLLQRPEVQHSHIEFSDLQSESSGYGTASERRMAVSELQIHPQREAVASDLVQLPSNAAIKLPSDAAAVDPFMPNGLNPVGIVPMETFLVGAEWSRWSHKHHKHKGPEGVHAFLHSVVLFDWCLFAVAIVIFLLLHTFILGRLSSKGWHVAVLLIWIVVGVGYNTVIWLRFGTNAGVSWLAGYLLEFIFLVENIFIFHIVVQAFKTPLRLTPKALHIVVWGQILFELVFFMGLAAWLRSFKALPYILGVWLIFCGLLAARGEPIIDSDIMETTACRAFTSCLGDRLSKEYEKDNVCLIKDSSGKLRVSLLGLVVVVLLCADFLLEIDVVLTKIEELPNSYIAFTSSALAAFAIPELFFVSKGLLQRFVMLKYGIGFVLILFGAQMLLSSIYILRPIVACCIIMTVLGGSIVASSLINIYRPRSPEQNAEAPDKHAEAKNDETMS